MQNVLSVGSIVQILRFPKTRWIVREGWYTHDNEVQNGWYLSAIPSGSIIPLTQEDMRGMTILEYGECNSNHYHHEHHHSHLCHPSLPPPHPCLPPSTEQRQVEDYIPGLDYKKGQLIWLEPGHIYQVSQDFTANSYESTPEKNMEIDIKRGMLITISSEGDSIGRIPNEKIDEIFNTI